jgi:hypothetical protein
MAMAHLDSCKKAQAFDVQLQTIHEFLIAASASLVPTSFFLQLTLSKPLDLDLAETQEAIKILTNQCEALNKVLSEATEPQLSSFETELDKNTTNGLFKKSKGSQSPQSLTQILERTQTHAQSSPETARVGT